MFADAPTIAVCDGAMCRAGQGAAFRLFVKKRDLFAMKKMVEIVQ